jgi:hypothetical protein
LESKDSRSLRDEPPNAAIAYISDSGDFEFERRPRNYFKHTHSESYKFRKKNPAVSGKTAGSHGLRYVHQNISGGGRILTSRDEVPFWLEDFNGRFL